ncbi:hypothetical protein CC85DRAFT_182844 [Cutaneotrichosporon oleaginosum]|uniref:Uncharacterized protein n=1 Tax=Cutaneotrichosporon oleaginosum TaxID=879819 RepID=A0A0J0XF23_9TREE|nr:uncharacterized protein CC85DRAFT_182844 [Cutaneotrichosporon oleaginosum]KLT39653.1 hypothetical protein CC85DRAFT_182844 [Cutaneotrichosporon oleaginosum]TXT07040.1 hypothetical protein COLE_06371 [Cutaneotrichosporon oleaginosum]
MPKLGHSSQLLSSSSTPPSSDSRYLQSCLTPVFTRDSAGRVELGVAVGLRPRRSCAPGNLPPVQVSTSTGDTSIQMRCTATSADPRCTRATTTNPPSPLDSKLPVTFCRFPPSSLRLSSRSSRAPCRPSGTGRAATTTRLPRWSRRQVWHASSTAAATKFLATRTAPSPSSSRMSCTTCPPASGSSRVWTSAARPTRCARLVCSFRKPSTSTPPSTSSSAHHFSRPCTPPSTMRMSPRSASPSSTNSNAFLGYC